MHPPTGRAVLQEEEDRVNDPPAAKKWNSYKNKCPNAVEREIYLMACSVFTVIVQDVSYNFVGLKFLSGS